MREASGLSEEAWLRFLPDCAFNFETPSPDKLAASEENSSLEVSAWLRDHGQLTFALFNLVADPSEPVQLTRDQLIDHLGWRSRADFHHRHEFPEPDLPYRAVRATSEALRAALARLTRGYILLRGSPGSGKSTLLTQTLRYEARVVRYYAYVPPSIGRSHHRGEATNFLHDVVLAIEEIGFRVGGTLPDGDEGSLNGRLMAQFALLSDDYRVTGRKTIILVDGLDHIAREQQPIRSLLRELPEPAVIPDGVIIVLGSQTERLPGLPTTVLSEVSEPERRLEMEPLERDDVLDIVRAADLSPAPDDEEQERIYRLSAGHPLALSYLLIKLRDSDGATVDEVLSQSAQFPGAIDAQYLEHWRQVSADFELVRLLALVARIRGAIRLSWLREWAPGRALHRMTHEFPQYFRREPGGRWSFFHNSFRVFLTEQTTQLDALQPDKLFLELADHCASAREGDSAKSDELYYRARGGDDVGVLALAQPMRWRTEFLGGRSASIILSDIQEALPIAIRQRDAVTLTRLLLAKLEFERRGYYTGRLPLTEVLIDLGDIDGGVESIAHGLELNGTEETAIRAAVALDDRELRDEARRIFSLAEPLSMLNGPARRRGQSFDHENRKLLTQWATAAPRFRSKDELLRFVGKLSVAAEPESGVAVGSSIKVGAETPAVDQKRTISLRANVLRTLAEGFDGLSRYDEADAILNELETLGEKAWGWALWGSVNGWRAALAHGQWERAQARYGLTQRLAASRQTENGDFSSQVRVALAEGAIRCANDLSKARKLVDSVAQPEVVPPDAHSTDPFSPFADRFFLNRVLGAIGDDYSPSTLIPDANGVGQPVVVFERNVVNVARLAGMAWTGRKLSPAAFVNECRGLLRMFASRPKSGQAWREGWSLIMAARETLYTLLIRAAAAHGPDVIAQLRIAFDREWDNTDFDFAWPSELRRAIVLAFLEHGAPKSWAIAHLTELEPQSFAAGELETELPLGVAQARAWIEVGEPEQAHSTLTKVFASTLGVEHKDYQLDAWIEWASRANQADPNQAAERVAFLARAASGLKDLDGYASAVTGILRVATDCGPAMSTALLRWYLDQAITTWTNAFETYLIGTVKRAQKAMPYAARIFRHLVIGYERAAEVELVQVLRTAADRTQESVAALADLAEGMDIQGLAGTRAALHAALNGDLAEAKLLARASYDRESPDDKPVDGMSEGKLTLREVRARVSTIDGAREIIPLLKGDSYLVPWEEMFRDFIAASDRDDLLELENLLPAADGTWKVRMRLANRLADLGETQHAFSIANTVFNSTRASSWIRQYDGGSRLTSLSLLARLDPVSAKERAWTVLGEDIVSGRVSTFSLLTEWDELVPLLTDDPPSVEIWNEIQPYVEAATEHAASLSPPMLPDAVEADVDVSEAAVSEMLEVAVSYLDHPMYDIAHGAQRLFVDLLLAGDTRAQAVILARLSADKWVGDGAVQVLRGVCQRDPGLIEFASEALLSRRMVKNIRARLHITELLSRMGREVPKTARSAIHQPLPSSYQVIDSDKSQERPLREAESGESLPQAQSAVDLVKVVEPRLRIVAAMAEVRYEALARDIALRAGATGGNPTPPDDEPAFREQMDALQLHLVFRRPRARLVESAMLEAVADLQDRGYLSPDNDRALAVVFENADPQLLLARPGRRPAAIPPIHELVEESDSIGRYVKDDWTHKLDLRASALARRVDLADDTATVIAEETWVRWLDWDLATETRVGALIALQAPEPPHKQSGGAIDEKARAAKALEEKIAALRYTQVSEYAAASGGASLFVRQYAMEYETPATEWIALNPDVGHRLGWTLAPEGLFRWVDGAGELMAESLWWEDGSSAMRPPHFEEEVGHGWLVVATAPALRQISGSVGATANWIRIERSARDQETVVKEDFREI
jgi:hypothetical protein